MMLRCKANFICLAAIVAWGAMAASGVASAAECMRFDRKAEQAVGALGIGEFKDAADRPESAFILRLPELTCLDAEAPEFRVREAESIHVYGTDEAVHARLEQLAGKRVIVRGRPFGAHTSHHHAPIVMEVTEIEVQ